MKKFFLICSVMLLGTGCVTTHYFFGNDDKEAEDVRGYLENPSSMYVFGRNWKVYDKETKLEVKEETKFKTSSYITYRFEVHAKDLPLIKLNSITFTRDINVDTVPLKFYYEASIKDTIDGKYKRKRFPVDKLPLIVKVEDVENRLSGVYVIAESTVSEEEYDSTNLLYISYDIEIGEQHIIRENIRYKTYLIKKVRPHFSKGWWKK